VEELQKAIARIIPIEEHLTKTGGGPMVVGFAPLQPTPLPTPFITPLHSASATPQHSPPGSASSTKRPTFTSRHRTESAMARHRDARNSAKQAARLRVVHRSLLEALEIFEANDEDKFIAAVLRQHQEAMNARDVADTLCERQVQCVQDVRTGISEVEWNMRRDEVESNEIHSIENRVRVLEQHCTDAQATRDSLQSDLDKMGHDLAEVTARNLGTQARIKQIEAAHGDCLAENARAQHTLGPLQKFDTWKKIKEHERTNAQDSLYRAQDACEAQIMRLSKAIADERAKCDEDLRGMRREVQELESRFEERQAETQGALNKQAAEKQRLAAEADSIAAVEKRRFEDLCHKRCAVMQRDAELARQRLEEAAKAAELNLELYRQELRQSFRARARLAQAASTTAVENEQQVTVQKRQQAERWSKHADYLRVKHKAATMTHGKYIPGDIPAPCCRLARQVILYQTSGENCEH